MQLSHVIHNDICIVFLTGNFSFDTSAVYEDHMLPLTTVPELKGVICNCQDLEFVDSTGLSLLIATAQTLQERDVPFALCNLNKNVFSTFIQTKLDRIMRICTTESEALEFIQSS